LRLWLLDKYAKNEELPLLTTNVIKMAFRILVEDSRGPKPKGVNAKIYDEFDKFYINKYSKLNYSTKISGKNLSQIICYESVDILTNIENNIKLNFTSYVKRFVNCSFKDEYNKINDEKINKQTKLTKMKLFKKELFVLKQDLLKNTSKCNPKYFDWLNENRSKIVPLNIIKSYDIDTKSDPQKYLKHMIYMNIKLELMEKKMFQFFPLRTNIAPKYTSIDTKSIIEILVDSDKNKYLSDIENNKKQLWNKYFDLTSKMFKLKTYSFDYFIRTDGYATSIQFISKNELVNQKKKKENMKTAKQSMKENCSKMNEDEKNIYKLKLKQDNKIQMTKKRLLNKELFKKLSKEEQQKIINEKNDNKYIEFPYLDEINENELNYVRKALKVYVDPGKRDLVTMMDDLGRTLKYSNRQRLFETKRLKYHCLLANYKSKNQIFDLEKELSSFNSKTCDFSLFEKYIKKKNQINEQLFEAYENVRFRQYKWYGYINKKRSEDNLLNKIERTFGKDCVIIYGDWVKRLASNLGAKAPEGVTKQMRNFISTPMIGLKRKIHERFTMYNLDEFRTSILHHKTENKCTNLYLPDKNNIFRKQHSILTYTMENKRLGCINRDINSVKNMKKIVDHWMIHKERPLKYQRSYDFDKENQNSFNQVAAYSTMLNDSLPTNGAITVL
jgi:hypothetical protein